MAVHVIDEANRCLQCKNQCASRVPHPHAHTGDHKIDARGTSEEAGKSPLRTTPMSLVCLPGLQTTSASARATAF